MLQLLSVGLIFTMYTAWCPVKFSKVTVCVWKMILITQVSVEVLFYHLVAPKWGIFKSYTTDQTKNFRLTQLLPLQNSDFWVCRAC